MWASDGVPQPLPRPSVNSSVHLSPSSGGRRQTSSWYPSSRLQRPKTGASRWDRGAPEFPTTWSRFRGRSTSGSQVDIKGRSVGTVLENQSGRPSGECSLSGSRAGASTDTPLSRERRGSASFKNIKAIAGDKGKKGDGSSEAWTCPPASSCGQLPECPPLLISWNPGGPAAFLRS